MHASVVIQWYSLLECRTPAGPLAALATRWLTVQPWREPETHPWLVSGCCKWRLRVPNADDQGGIKTETGVYGEGELPPSLTVRRGLRSTSFELRSVGIVRSYLNSAFIGWIEVVKWRERGCKRWR